MHGEESMKAGQGDKLPPTRLVANYAARKIGKPLATTHEYQIPEVNSMSLGTTTCEACGSAAPR